MPDEPDWANKVPFTMSAIAHTVTFLLNIIVCINLFAGSASVTTTAGPRRTVVFTTI
jgi:hypothetical protein